MKIDEIKYNLIYEYFNQFLVGIKRKFIEINSKSKQKNTFLYKLIFSNVTIFALNPVGLVALT